MKLRLRLRNEDGVAMVTVLLITFVLLLVVAGTMSYAVGSLPLSRHDQDWNAALAAAEAGLDDYVFRLNQNVQYYTYSATSLPPGDTTATSPFTSWKSVPGPNVPPGTSFRYSVDLGNITSQGAIILTSTGRACTRVSGSACVGSGATRSIQATLRRASFLDYQYFTDYETKDPATYDSGDYYSPADAQTYCAKHYYEGRDINGRTDFPGDSDSNGRYCTDIYFASADTLNGPVHTNDAIAICGSPTFASTASDSWNTTGNRYFTGCSNSNPSFSPGDPSYHAPLTMPPSNIALRADADATLGGVGCLFTGPTSITLNSSGTMTVVSPFTKWPASPNNCQPGSNRPLPTNGVIYVQSVPSSSSDPNYTSGCITSTQIGGFSTVQHPLGYPQRYDVTSYGCTDGDVFLKGTLKGRVTIAAENNIEVIGNVTYQGGTGGTDLLGLVANNNVEIYHPVAPNGTTTGVCDGSFVQNYCNLRNYAASSSATTAFRDPTIYGAILSVQHSFTVQNYTLGQDNPLGDIHLVGALAQKYRGAVGTVSTTGYGKDYNYDQRLKYQSPPRFLNPIAAAWQIVTWIEKTPVAFAWNAA